MRKRFIPLSIRFIFLTTTLLLLLLGTLAFLLTYYQSRNARTQLIGRGLATAESLAAACKAALIMYDYVTLAQNAEQVAEDPDIAYVIIHDKEGRVAGYSGHPELQQQFLSDPLTRTVLAAPGRSIEPTRVGPNGVAAMAIAVPVYPPQSRERWGTVRVALSLEPMLRQIRQIQLIIAASGLVALAVGVLLSIALARRITRPLGRLVTATVEAAQGNLDQDLEVTTGDEVEVLATNFLAMTREIRSQRRQLEQQLFEITRLQDYTQRLFTTMHDGLLSIDREGRIATINPAAAKILGHPREQAVGLEARGVLSGLPELRNFVAAALAKGGRPVPTEVEVRGKGPPRVFLVGVSELRGRPAGAFETIFNIQEITELKRLEARIRQAERLAALGTLSAGMAHEIRNPLSAIKTFVQLLPRKLDRPGFLEKFQRTVPRELNRINQLVTDLLELARDPKYIFNAVDARRLILEVAELHEPECERHHIRYRFQVAADLPAILADSHQLRKAFDNLIRNAVEAMPDGGELLIEAACVQAGSADAAAIGAAERWVAISFRDTGGGIAEDALKQIFNPFFTTKDTGTGLGLAITHKVVSEHGGHIEVVSHDGAGTEFKIALPAIDSSRVEGRMPV